MYKYHYYNATLNLWFCPGKYPKSDNNEGQGAVVDVIFLNLTSSPRELRKARPCKLSMQKKLFISKIGNDTGFGFSGHGVGWKLGSKSCDDLWGGNHVTKREDLGREVVKCTDPIMNRSVDGRDS